MSKTKEALEMAIEALGTLMMEKGSIYQRAINACKEALEQPAQSITESATMFKQVGNSSKPPSPLPPIHTCIYSRTMNQEYPRKCIQCGKVEALEQPTNMVTVPLDKLEDMQRRLKALEKAREVALEWECEHSSDSACKKCYMENVEQEFVAEYVGMGKIKWIYPAAEGRMKYGDKLYAKKG